jgi:hypothetical protein
LVVREDEVVGRDGCEIKLRLHDDGRGFEGPYREGDLRQSHVVDGRDTDAACREFDVLDGECDDEAVGCWCQCVDVSLQEHDHLWQGNVGVGTNTGYGDELRLGVDIGSDCGHGGIEVYREVLEVAIGGEYKV